MVPADEAWPRLMSLAVHELRTPVTVVAGYLRLVLKGRVGPVADEQRRMLEEAEKSCARISALLAEMSDLAHLELGDAAVSSRAADLSAVLREVVEGAAQGPDIPAVTLRDDRPGGPMQGDPARLKAAFAALLHAVQRELPLESSVIVERSSRDGSTVVAIGRTDAIAELSDSASRVAAPADGSEGFDELRGGMGLALPLARHVIHRHAGRLVVLSDRPQAGVAVVFPT
jgi:signal transduction histidine kinase